MCDLDRLRDVDGLGRDHALAVVPRPALPRHVLRREHARLIDQRLVEMAVGAFERADEGALLGPAIPVLVIFFGALRAGCCARRREDFRECLSFSAPGSLGLDHVSRPPYRASLSNQSGGEDNAAQGTGTASGRGEAFRREEHGVCACTRGAAGCGRSDAGAASRPRAERRRLLQGQDRRSLHRLQRRRRLRSLRAHARAPHGQAHPRQSDRRAEEHGRRGQPAARQLALQRRARRTARRSASSAAAPASIRCSATRRRSSTPPSSPGSAAPTTRSASASPGTPAASPNSRTC